jgi:hypothetical protein
VCVCVICKKKTPPPSLPTLSQAPTSIHTHLGALACRVLVLLNNPSETKVRHLANVVLAHEHVARGKIAMDVVLGLEVRHA